MKENVDVKKPPILFNDTQRVIGNIKELIDGDFLSYWISDNGNLHQEDAIPLYKILNKKIKKKTLFFFIKSGGGSEIGALRIIHLLRNFYTHIVALIPLECASAATMLTLGANEIMMGPLAYLSAIDTSITHELSPIENKYNNKVSVSQNELNHHDNGIIKVMEVQGKQIFYQIEKDWHYLAEERRYISLNEESSWREVQHINNELDIKKLYIS
jgi:hypothetical protein